MSYSLTLKAKIKNIEKVFKAIEKESGTKDRSSLTSEKKEGSIQFKVSANDVVALKATINTIIKILTIYEGSIELLK